MKYIQAYIFIMLHFIVFFFYKLKACGNPVLSKSIDAIFPQAFAYFLIAVSHFGNSRNISKLLTITKFSRCYYYFSLLLVYTGGLWSVIFDGIAPERLQFTEGPDDG